MVSETTLPQSGARGFARGIAAVAAGLRRGAAGGGVRLRHLCAADRPDALHAEPRRADRAAAGQLTLVLSLARADRLAAGAAVGGRADPAAPAPGCMCGWSTWFSAIAVVPAILVAVFAAVTLNLGLDAMVLRPGEGRAGQRGQRRPASMSRNMSAASSSDADEIADDIQHDPHPVRRRTSMSTPALHVRQARVHDQGSRPAGVLHPGQPRQRYWPPAKLQLLDGSQAASRQRHRRGARRVDRGGRAIPRPAWSPR